MTTPTWQPGKLYPTGSLVVPRTALPPAPVVLQNPSWESGNTTGWDVVVTGTVTGFAGVRAKDPHDGIYIYALDSSGGDFSVVALNDEQPVCTEGTLITARMWIRRSLSGGSSGRLVLRWYDSGGIEISTTESSLYTQAETWINGQVSGVAPAGTASVRAGFSGEVHDGGDIRFDTLSWNYDTAAPPQGLMYKAVQPTIGTSDNVEPTWPIVLGVQVIDNTVIWEAVLMSRVVYKARSILRSGATEPTWPTVVGERVEDNTIAWETATRQVEQAPNSKVVAITASKVFAADKDIIRYSATVNPLDWESTDNAGYLPSGLNQNGSNDTAVLNIYRSNIVGFSSSTFQNWQVDEDPANMELLDVMEGIGSTWQHAAQPVARDLFYLAALGVRTVGISGGSLNLVNGDAGMPVDPLVRAAIRAAEANSEKPLGMYYPSLGQYMLAFPDYPPTHVAIHGDLELAGVNMPLPPFTYTGTGGVKPYSFALINGTSLPPGLALNANGSVTGTPTETGTFTWDVQITDSLGDTDWKTDTAEILLGPSISGDAPDGALGIDYAGYAYTVTAGAAPIVSVTIHSGSLPSGLAMDNSGVIDIGPPTLIGDFPYTVRALDENGIYADLADTIGIDAVSFATINADPGHLALSLTGEVWTGDIDTGLNAPIVLLKALGGRLFAFDADGNGRVSDDYGQSFVDTTGVVNPDTNRFPGAMTYSETEDGPVWLLVWDSSKYVSRSTNGVDFTTAESLVTNRSWYCGAGKGDAFVFGGTQGSVAFSPDGGVTWEDFAIFGISSDVEAITVCEDHFIAFAPALINKSETGESGSWSAGIAAPGFSGKNYILALGERIVFTAGIQTFYSDDIAETFTQGGDLTDTLSGSPPDNNITHNGLRFILGIDDAIDISDDSVEWVAADFADANGIPLVASFGVIG